MDKERQYFASFMVVIAILLFTWALVGCQPKKKPGKIEIDPGVYIEVVSLHGCNYVVVTSPFGVSVEQAVNQPYSCFTGEQI